MRHNNILSQAWNQALTGYPSHWNNHPNKSYRKLSFWKQQAKLFHPIGQSNAEEALKKGIQIVEDNKPINKFQAGAPYPVYPWQ